MIRSRQVPPLLSRICGDGIQSASIMTSDGELLGSSYRRHSESHGDRVSLVADLTADYVRLGAELRQRQLYYLQVELSKGIIGVASAGPDCFVTAFADPTVPTGMLKARLTACAAHVQEAFTPLTEPT